MSEQGLMNKCFLFLFSIFLFIPWLSNEAHARRSCGCSSGCGLELDGLQPAMRQLVNNAMARGMRPTSCVRTQSCQNALIGCYNRCGQRGRAARRSAHSDGKACDWNRGYMRGINSIKSGEIGLLFHHGVAHYQLGRSGSGRRYTSRRSAYCRRHPSVPSCRGRVRSGRRR
jgi:hypothetical protein